jgi:hypothetical protein
MVRKKICVSVFSRMTFSPDTDNHGLFFFLFQKILSGSSVAYVFFKADITCSSPGVQSK